MNYCGWVLSNIAYRHWLHPSCKPQGWRCVHHHPIASDRGAFWTNSAAISSSTSTCSFPVTTLQMGFVMFADVVNDEEDHFGRLKRWRPLWRFDRRQGVSVFLIKDIWQLQNNRHKLILGACYSCKLQLVTYGIWESTPESQSAQEKPEQHIFVSDRRWRQLDIFVSVRCCR